MPTTATFRPSSGMSCRHRAEWKTSPSNSPRPGSGGDRRTRQCSGGHHEVLRCHRAQGGLDGPPLRIRVPLGGRHFAGSDQPLPQSDRVRDPHQVVTDFWLTAERMRPARMGVTRKRVQRRGDVTRAPRIGVVAPGAAHLLRGLEHKEIGVVLLEQPVRHRDSTESGTDDESSDRVHRPMGSSDHISDSALSGATVWSAPPGSASNWPPTRP